MNDIIGSGNFNDLRAFLSVAEHGSFVGAARALSVSPPALSQTLKRLEARLGIRLFNRTTRSVALTEAGAKLLDRVVPLVDQLREALVDATATAQEPHGALRITLSRVAARHVIVPHIAAFNARYPRINVELDINDRLVDIVANRFDCGIRLGGSIERDLIALRLGSQRKCSVVAAPSLIAAAGAPDHPRDLLGKPCLRFRWPGAKDIYRWEFERADDAFQLEITTGAIVNDTDIMLELAASGLGFAYALDCEVESLVEAGRVTPVLDSWLPRFSGFYLYHSSRHQVPVPLRLFLDFLKRAAERSPTIPNERYSP